MKKTYIKPEVNLFRIELQKMVAASDEEIIAITDSTTEVVESRRRFSVWGDDDE